jgi:energy-coupling factor transport system permease protein
VAASLPPLIGRNPFPLIAVLVAAAGVRVAWQSELGAGIGWTRLLQLAVVFSAIGVLFNVLTVRAGDRVIATFPEWLPLIGGDAITLNALIFGLLSGLALLVLVLVGTTAGALLDWAAIVRILPESLTGVAVAGSVAFAFIPQTVAALGEIREAQAARGHRVRGGRDLVPILVPLLATGLERAVVLSESLESRGFGAPVRPGHGQRGWQRGAIAISLTLLALGAYLTAVGRLFEAVAALALALVLAVPAVHSGRALTIRRTRYRPLAWHRRDSVVAAAACMAAAVTLLIAATDSEALRYNPYPILQPPIVSIPLISALLLLLAPAFFAPNLRGSTS